MSRDSNFYSSSGLGCSFSSCRASRFLNYYFLLTTFSKYPVSSFYCAFRRVYVLQTLVTIILAVSSFFYHRIKLKILLLNILICSTFLINILRQSVSGNFQKQNKVSNTIYYGVSYHRSPWYVFHRHEK